MGIKKPEKSTGKKIQAHESSSRTNYDLEHPQFALRYIQKSHCLSACYKEEKAALADTLHKLSQLPWLEIKRAPRHGLGYEKIPRHKIKSGIPLSIPEDAEIIAFRFYSKAPMVGYRAKAVFYILWLDRDFTLYEH